MIVLDRYNISSDDDEFYSVIKHLGELCGASAYLVESPLRGEAEGGRGDRLPAVWPLLPTPVVCACQLSKRRLASLVTISVLRHTLGTYGLRDADDFALGEPAAPGLVLHAVLAHEGVEVCALEEGVGFDLVDARPKASSLP